jgi:phage terminase large subunit-like protein
MAGLNLDPWQQWILEGACSQRTETYYNPFSKEWERMWAARDVGLVVARQNGKGSILEARQLAGLFLFGEKTIIHSAQDFATSGEHFRRVASLIQDTPALNKELKGCYEANGKERIELKNGARLLFKTRTKKLGRGFSPQLVVLDEAMFLDEDSMMALRPTLSAQPNPQIWFTGSAGLEDAMEFGRVRHRALSGIAGEPDPFLFFAEWSADVCTDFCLPSCDEHDSLDDPEVWAKANPGFGIRISQDTVANELRAMSEDAFRVERLSVGRWPAEGDAWAVIDEESWRAREDEDSEILMGGRKNTWVLAVDVSPTRAWGCITACGVSDEGMTHVEITGYEQYDYRPGADWIPGRIREMWSNMKPDAVIIDDKGQASSLIEELENFGVKVVSPTTSEYAVACGEFHTGCVPRKGEVPKIVHTGQPPLTNAVAAAAKRDLADKWAWDKKNATSDISPLVAATLATWGFKKLSNEQPAAAPWIAYGS